MRSGSTVRRLSFATLASSAALLALEGAARLLPAAWTARRAQVVRDAVGDGVMVADDAVPGWDLRPAGGMAGETPYPPNRWTMRSPPYGVDKGPGVRRVIFVGDSSVFGVKLRWEETFSARFAERRQRRHPDQTWQAANCAAPGHSTVQSREKLRVHCLAFQPDLVVIANQFSDATRTTETDRVRFAIDAELPLARALDAFALYRLPRNAWLRRSIAKNPVEPEFIGQISDPAAGDTFRVPPEEYAENLTAMVRMAQDAGAAPALLMLARTLDLTGDRGSPHRDAMRAVAAAEGVTLVDAPAWYHEHGVGEEAFIDLVHPSARGALMLAIMLDEQLP